MSCLEQSVIPSKENDLQTTALNIQRRKIGKDRTFVGDTMTGWARRLDNVRELLEHVVRDRVPGDYYIETGVWRGGSSIFARAVMNSLDNHHRMIS